MERRLAAILAADVVGYSRLIGVDEAGTLAALKAHRKELIEPKIAEHKGRIVKLMGDGVLAEFPSAVEAVQCAVQIQHTMTERNTDGPEERRITYRIGINIGDIVVEDDDIYGDGVNVAARLESLAKPGGICVRRNVRNQVRDKLDIDFEDLGEVEVKNIARPVRAFRVVLDAKAAALVTPVVRVSGKPMKRSRLIAVAGMIALLVAAGGVVWWRHWAPDVEPASLERMAFPLPEEASIAVLPFKNLSDEPEQEYFADGLTNDIITDLSRMKDLFVIASNSTFTYKDKPVKVQQVAEELGVHYVLEGSVQKTGDKIRINTQLIDATNGRHLWADRYGGTLADLFALQDQVTQRIVSALAVNLTPAELARQTHSETDNQEAYDAFLRGWAYYRRSTPGDFAEAIPYFEQAVVLDPDYSRAHAALAAIYWTSIAKNVTGRGGLWAERLGLTHEGARLQGNEYLKFALKNPTPLAHQVASSVRSHQGRHDLAVAEARQAVELDPNDPIGYEALAAALIYAGRPSEGDDAIRKAMRVDPHYPSEYLVWLGLAQFGQDRFEEAVVSLRTAVQRNPDDDTALTILVAAYGNLGRGDDATSSLQALNDLRTKRGKRLSQAESEGIEAGIDSFLVGTYTLNDIDLWPFDKQTDRERLRVGLAKAGVPKSSAGQAESPTGVAGSTTIAAAEAKALFDRGVAFVDVRTLARWNLGHVPRAVLLDLKADFNEASLLTVAGKDQEIVIYCEGPKCLRSSQACSKAVSWGFTRTYYYREGFPSWRAAGYPVAVE